MRALIYAVAGLVLGLVLLAGLWPVARHRLIYPGGTLSPDRSEPASHGLPHGEEVWLDASDGVRIHAWWVPARGDSARGAVVYCHGNAETLATRAWIADRLSGLGYHTLLFDYRGYGLSEGRASEEGLARDARAAWGHVVETRGIAPDRVVLMGHSLGSAVATRLALELESGRVAGPADDHAPPEPTPPAGLVVGSPFPSMPALFAHHAPWLPGRALRWRTDRLDAGSRLDEVRIPKLVIIGTNDDVIPPEMSREVYADASGIGGGTGNGRITTGDGRAIGDDASGAGPARATSPALVTVPADHATMMGQPEVWTALERFLDDAVRAGG